MGTSEIRKFVKILRESQDPGSPDSDWLWIVGTGVTAAVTGNRPEATWLGLVKAAVEHLKSNEIDLGMINPLMRDGLDAWKPNSANLFAAVDIITDAFGDHHAVTRWISSRMEDLESNVVNGDLLLTLGQFSWPIATTNYDNLLALKLTGGMWSALTDLNVREIEAWRRKSKRFILHLHGHRTKSESLLFTKGSYETYLRQKVFLDGMSEVFRGRPVFIGCKDTLIDPNIGLALLEQFKLTKDHGREPIVLLREKEQLDFNIPVQQICYGTDYSDLLPFLQSVFAESYRAQSREAFTISASNMSHPAEDGTGFSKMRVWRKAYFDTIERNHRYLKLTDFRTADRDVLLPLDDIYVALVFDPRSAQERLEESRALHHAQAESGRMGNAQDAFPRPILAPERTQTPVTLADVLSDNAWAVILGDPGSGKTTLMHWLMRQCASARINERAEIVAEPQRLNPDAEPSLSLKRVGPAWLPILVSVPEYARKRIDLGTEAKRRLSHYLAITVLSRIREGGEDAAIEDVAKWIDEEATKGRLLVLIDGLDESTNDDERRNIVEEIQDLRVWVSDGFGGKPGERGNNRVLITSRIAGYKHAPLSIDISHYTIEPLKVGGVRRLLNHLFTAVEHSPAGDDETSTSDLESMRVNLLEQLGLGGSATLASLAASPVLASALFTFFLARQGVLPEDRRELYQGIIDLFMRRETHRLKLDDGEGAALRAIFQELAFEAFQSPRSGLIPEESVRRKLSALGDHTIIRPFNRAFGPLAPMMPGEYGFLHRTFQEYLCAEYLTRTDGTFAELVNLAGMPTWSEPAKLAFMIWAKPNPEKTKRDQDLAALRRVSSLGNAFRPIALALAALGETPQPEADLFHCLVAISIDTLADALPNWREVPEDLTAALRELCKLENGFIALEEGIEEALLEASPRKGNRQVLHAMVAARLMIALDLFDPQLVESLQNAYEIDEESLGWPITSALLRAVTPELPATASRSDWVRIDREFSGRAGQAYHQSDPATYFERRPRELEELSKSAAGVRMLVALMGGHRDYQLGEVRERYDSIVAFLQLPDWRRASIGLTIPVFWERIAKQHRKPGEDEDKISALAVYLHTTGGHQFKSAAAVPPTFQISACVIPSRGWSSVRQHLVAGAMDAARCWPVLDVCVNPQPIKELEQPEERREAFNLRYRVSDAARRAIRSMNSNNAEALMKGVPQLHHTAVLDALAAVGSSLGELGPLSAFEEYFRQFRNQKALPQDAEAVVNVERLAAVASMFQDDRRNTTAQWLDDSAQIVPFANLCRARSSESKIRSDMPHLPPPYLGNLLGCGIQDDLTGVERLPSPLDFLAEYTVTNLLDDKTLSFALPELAAVMSRLPWAYSYPDSVVSRFGFDPSKDQSALRSYVGGAEKVWQLRARVRLLAAFSPEERRHEELSIESELRSLSLRGGLFVAQCAELLAARARYCPVSSLVDLALSVPNLEPTDAACLRLRVLPLIEDPSKALNTMQKFFSIMEKIDDERVRASILHWASRQKSWPSEIDSLYRIHIAGIHDSVSRAFASDQPGAVLLEAIDQFMSGDPFWGGEVAAPLVVYARLSDALKPAPAFSGPAPLEGTLQAVEQAAGRQNEYELVTAVAHASIPSPLGLNRLCRANESVLQTVDLDRQLHAVVSASVEGVGPHSIEGLVSALGTDYDELRARAISLLLPPIEIKNDGKTGLSASGCGLETLLRLVESSSRTRPGVVLTVHWRLEKTILDSVEIAERLCDLAEGEGDRAIFAQHTLRGFKLMTPDVEESLAMRMGACSPSLRAVLWLLFSRALHFSSTSRNQMTALRSNIFCGHLDGVSDPEFVLAGPEDLVSALQLKNDDPKATMDYLVESLGISLSEAFSSSGLDRISQIRKIGATRFTRSPTAEEHHEDFSKAAESLLQIEDGPLRAVNLLIHLTQISLEDPQPGSYLRSDLVVLLAAAAERSPTRTVVNFENLGPRKLIATLASRANSFPARRAAFLLMGHILDRPGREPMPIEIDALISSVLDVPDVIDAALSATGRIRALSRLGVRKLIETLHHRSAARASLAGRMLIVIARNIETSQNLRDQIFDSIRDFIADPRSGRQVYFNGLDATTPPAPTIREQLLKELSASSGGAVQRR